jgi:chromosomal replication initiator protein
MIRVADIQAAVADLYGIPQHVMREPDGLGHRARDTRVRPRQVAMYLCRQICSTGKQREETRTSMQAIGRCFNRDHSTVSHACRQVERFMLADTEERRAVGEVGLRLIEGVIANG